jgi:hypothetical protein
MPALSLFTAVDQSFVIYLVELLTRIARRHTSGICETGGFKTDFIFQRNKLQKLSVPVWVVRM